MNQQIVLTGCAGFIGYHTAKALLERGDRIIGVDNLNDHNEREIKEDRLRALRPYEEFQFVYENIAEPHVFDEVFAGNDVDAVCHLAARPGVRKSFDQPFLNEESNVKGTMALFEAAKDHDVQNLVCASSSSVYGGNETVPFEETQDVSQPISVYAATKRMNELLGHVYHQAYDLQCTFLRFFTVYGPFGRPDMAYFKFARRIVEDRPIDVYNYGDMRRDFTYISDIVEGTISAIDAELGYEIMNLGSEETRELGRFIEILEQELGKEAEKHYKEKPAGDMEVTAADISKARKVLDYEPTVSLEEGLGTFARWFLNYYPRTS